MKLDLKTRDTFFTASVTVPVADPPSFSFRPRDDEPASNISRTESAKAPLPQLQNREIFPIQAFMPQTTSLLDPIALSITLDTSVSSSLRASQVPVFAPLAHHRRAHPRLYVLPILFPQPPFNLPRSLPYQTPLPPPRSLAIAIALVRKRHAAFPRTRFGRLGRGAEGGGQSLVLVAWAGGGWVGICRWCGSSGG